MDRTPRGPLQPWESNAAGENEPAAVEDPVGLLGDMLLGRAGPAEGAIQQREIRVSSGLVLGGVCLGLAGFGVIALAQGQDNPYALRELGGVLGGAGLLVLLWGILQGLPSHRTLRVIGLTGMVVGALGMVAFVWAYPEQWGRQDRVDQTVPVLGTFVVGMVLLVFATFASLVADFVLRMQVKARLRGELGREPTDAEIQADIDEAWRRHKVTWGGTVADTGRGIKVRVEAVPKEWVAAMPRIGREVHASGERASAVDNAVDKLVDFRGGRMRRTELDEAGMGSSADALRALRAAQGAKPAKRTWLDRLLGRWPKPPPGYGPGAMSGPKPPLP
ncbi:MAG TPA: hypothetical protein VGR28_05600 [Candidatus Thermoplasmatota archaeon]|nr:hypothetical protein [Candidatus Thermoplasmatota archaeon]